VIFLVIYAFQIWVGLSMYRIYIPSDIGRNA
jgi:hypothetical protein